MEKVYLFVISLAFSMISNKNIVQKFQILLVKVDWRNSLTFKTIKIKF